MIRTVSVVVVGAILAILAIALEGYLAAYVLPMKFDRILYFTVMGVGGIVVGLLVGLFQTANVGTVAVICLLPALLLEVWSPYVSHWKAGELAFFLLGQFVQMTVAFLVARRVSSSRRGARQPAAAS